MSEEEAIKILECFNPVDCGMRDSKAIETLLIAYEKEKEKNKELEEALVEWINGERICRVKHISKDKIKQKIEYLLKRYDSEEDFCSYDVVISILQKLLEESE